MSYLPLACEALALEERHLGIGLGTHDTEVLLGLRLGMCLDMRSGVRLDMRLGICVNTCVRMCSNML